jgi:hypothetical protein
MASDPLSVESILKHMAEALPTHAKDDMNSDLSSSYEAIALFSHACMTAVGFRLLGFGENEKIGQLHYPAIQPTLSLQAHRIGMPTTCASTIAAMELLFWLSCLPICPFAVVDAVCGQGGSTWWEGGDSRYWPG